MKRPTLPARRAQAVGDRRKTRRSAASQHMPVRSRVAEVIKEAIFSGALKPGDPLRELHLAADLNVSQASVREALVQLENAGMVTRIRNKETIVTKLTPDDVRERLMIREALEILAWIEAAKRMGAEDYGKLYIAVEAISAAVESNDYYGLAVSDLEFHRSIWQSSRQPTLCRTLEQTTAPLFAFVMLIHVIQQDRLKETVNSHEVVIRACAMAALVCCGPFCANISPALTIVS